jgi:hypothetical protein
MCHNEKCFKRNLTKKITIQVDISRLRLKHSWTKPGHTYGYLCFFLWMIFDGAMIDPVN